jgi:Protein of unknown function (DUF2934)
MCLERPEGLGLVCLTCGIFFRSEVLDGVLRWRMTGQEWDSMNLSLIPIDTELLVPYGNMEPSMGRRASKGPYEERRVESFQEQVAGRAYQLFLERGERPGSAQEDWYRAERELLERAAVAQKNRTMDLD